MTLLFDQNLSYRLKHALDDLFPQSVQVRDVGLQAAPDLVVWEYAAAQGLTIVSKDSDFHQRSLLYGHPPKIVWLRLGNCSTDDLARLLREHAATIARFGEDPSASFLILP